MICCFVFLDFGLDLKKSGRVQLVRNELLETITSVAKTFNFLPSSCNWIRSLADIEFFLFSDITAKELADVQLLHQSFYVFAGFQLHFLANSKGRKIPTDI